MIYTKQVISYRIRKILKGKLYIDEYLDYFMLNYYDRCVKKEIIVNNFIEYEIFLKQFIRDEKIKGLGLK